jgi:hypothetical protein
LLLTQRYDLAVPLSRPHAPQMDFFLQNQSSFDDEDLLDNGNHRCVALLSDKRRDDVDWSGDCDALNVDPVVSKGLVNQVVMTDGADIYPDVPLDFSTFA